MPLLLRIAVLSLVLSVGLSGAVRAEAPRLGEGVVVDEIPAENVLGKAGVLPGDVLYSWERLPSPPENPAPAAGEFTSPFDWEWMAIEQMTRGTVRLSGKRQGRPLIWEVPTGYLGGTYVRPILPPDLLAIYEHGRALLAQKRTEEAMDCWRFLAEKFQRSGDSRAAWLFWRMGSSLAELMPWKEAEPYYEAALALTRDSRSRVSLLYHMGDLYGGAWRLIEAEECYLALLRIAESTWGRCLMMALAELKLGWFAGQQGKLETARTYLEQALAIERESAPRSVLLAETLRALGDIYFQEGDLESAERHFLTTLQMERADAPGSPLVTSVMHALANVYQSRGDLDRAEDLFRQVLERTRKSPSETLPVYLVSLANCAQKRHDLATARKLYRQALDLAAKMDPDSLAHVRILRDLGRLTATDGDLPATEAYYRQAKESLQRVAPVSQMLATILTDLGALYASRGDLVQAEGELRASLALSERLAPKSWQRAKTLHLLALVLRRKGATTQAASELGRALECLEAQVQQLGGSEEAKGEFRAEAGSLYRDAVRQELDLHRPGEAFRLLERFRAQSFLFLLAERDLTFSADIPAALDRERRRLAILYDQNELRLATLDPEKRGAAVATLQREQLRLREKREEIDAEIRRSSPRLSAMIHPQTLDFERVRAALEPGTVMLSYSVGAEETELFVVTPGKDLAVRSLPLGEEALRKEVTHLRQLVEQVQSRAGLGAEGLNWVSRQLYQQLVQPAEPWISAGQRILIVPDGPLHVLPFAALLRNTEEKRSGRGQYLVEWKPIHTALSGTVYAELKARRRGPGDASNPAQWVGFGDPWFPPHLAKVKPEETGETRLRSFSTRTGLRWQRLPESRREVEQIAALFPEGDRKVYLDREATEEKAKALGRDARIVHFATHGFVDDRSPFDSGLVLAIPEQFAEGHDNGLLQVWEIFESVRLDADLVVLSACETGLGEIRGGEGVIGLTRAFQYAGARSVLASLWRVDDKATADLMERFYRHLRAGEAKDEALRAAQLEMLARPGGGAAAPYFWASMQLFGDWR